MTQYDLHLEGQPDSGAIADAVAHIFGVAPRRIALLDSHESLPSLAAGAFPCVLSRRRGQFQLTVQLYPPLSAGSPPEASVAEALSLSLGCRVLVTDSDLNPYSWILIDGSTTQAVALDPEAFDRDELTLSKAAAQ